MSTSPPHLPLLSNDNLTKRRSMQQTSRPSSYGDTVKLQNIIESTCGIIFGLLFIPLIVLFILNAAIPNNTGIHSAFYIPLSLYQFATIILCIYYCLRFEWNDIKNIIQFNKFWIESLFCFLFNMISFIILITTNNDDDSWYIVHSMSYLLGAFSIPFPAICIYLHYEYKYNQHNTLENGASQTNVHSVAASVAAGKPIFRDNILKVSISMCYIAHFLRYIGDPLLNTDPFKNMINKMYPHDNNAMYYINQAFLRIFMGMTLCSVFFIFIIQSTDKQITNTKYCVLWQILKGQGKRYWIVIMLTICIISIPFEFFVIRDSGDVIGYILNIIWILINLTGSLVLCYFICLFSGIYSKTKYKFQKMYNVSPKSPIIAFVLEGMLLLCLYLIYILFLFIHHYEFGDKISFDIYRQSSILILLSLEFITLIRMKQIQKFGKIYLNRFKKKDNILLCGYYKFISVLLIYDIIYIFIFNIEYFGDINQGKNEMVAFAFSFSVPASILLMISHLIYSYHKWMNDVIKDVNESEINSNSNDNLNNNLGSDAVYINGSDLSSTKDFESIMSK